MVLYYYPIPPREQFDAFVVSQSVRGRGYTGKEQLTQIVRTEEYELIKGLCSSMKRVICSRILIGRPVTIIRGKEEEIFGIIKSDLRFKAIL